MCDYLNQMIARSITADNTTTSEAYIYSNGQIVLEYNTSGSADVLKTVNLWGANVDELVATERLALSTNESNQILWSYADHLNSIRDVVIYNPTTDSTTTVNHLIFDAFGNLLSSVDPTNSNATISPILVFRYTGKYFDDATGLQNNLNRWYDATTGKWISVDPIGFNGSDNNLYRYVGNRPLVYTDSLGLWKKINTYHYYAEEGDTLDGLLSQMKLDGLKLRSGKETEIQYCIIPIVRESVTIDGIKYKTASREAMEIAWNNTTITPCGIYNVIFMTNQRGDGAYKFSIGYDAQGNNGFISWSNKYFEVEKKNRNISGKKMYDILDSAIAKSKKPMKLLDIIGHWVNNGEVGGSDRLQSIITINGNVFGSATNKRSWNDAIQGKVPPIAWFADNSIVRFLGCSTTQIANDFARNYLRGNATAYGTKMQLWISARLVQYRGHMNNFYKRWKYDLWFSQDGKSYDGEFNYPQSLDTKFWKGYRGE